MKLAGKVAVVTGASMGIGEAIARLFAEEGASVVLTSRDAARAEAARARIGHGERTLAVACDVRRRSDLEALLQATLVRFGRVDIWVNNAGHGLLDSVAGVNMDACRELFATNLFGAIEGLQLAAAVMQRQGSGSIINISSVSGYIPIPHHAIYSASKSAMNAIGHAARVEFERSGVHVMTVCPGYIATDFAANAVRGPGALRPSVAQRGSSVERVARAVLRGYLRKKREVVVPWAYRLAIKLYQVFPSLLEQFMMRQLRPVDEVIAASRAARKPG